MAAGFAYSHYRLPPPNAALAPGAIYNCPQQLPAEAGLNYYVPAIVLELTIAVLMVAGDPAISLWDVFRCISTLQLDTRVLGTLVKSNTTGVNMAFWDWVRTGYLSANMTATIPAPATGQAVVTRRAKLTIPIGRDLRRRRGNVDYAINTLLFSPEQDNLIITIGAANCYAPIAPNAVLQSVTVFPYVEMFSDERCYYPCVLGIDDFQVSTGRPAINPIKRDNSRADPVDVWLEGSSSGPLGVNVATLTSVESPADGIPSAWTPARILDQFYLPNVMYAPFQFQPFSAAPIVAGAYNLANMYAFPLRYQPGWERSKMCSYQMLEDPDMVDLQFIGATPAQRYLQGTAQRYNEAQASILRARAGIRGNVARPFTDEGLDTDDVSLAYAPRWLSAK